MTDASQPSTPVEWTIDAPGRRDRLELAVAVVLAAPRTLWVLFVVVLPTIALVAVPLAGSSALAAFALLALLPGIVAWRLAGRRHGVRYELRPDSSTLLLPQEREGPAEIDAPDDVRIDLRDLDRATPTRIGDRVAVRLRYGGLRLGGDGTPRLVVVPLDRWPAFAAALDRVDRSVPESPTALTAQPGSLAVVGTTAIVVACGVVASLAAVVTSPLVGPSEALGIDGSVREVS